MKTALVWFRRDLRIADHPALAHACAEADRVLPVFLHAPHEESPWAPGAASRWWLHHSLAGLDADLRKLGAPLLVRQPCDSLAELRALARETGAEGVFWNRLYEPALIKRDERIKRELRADGLTVESFNAALLAEPWTRQTRSGGPYKVFTPFWKALRPQLPDRGLVAAPRRIVPPASVPQGCAIDALGLRPAIAWDGGLAHAWRPGERGAHALLGRFCEEAVAEYPEGRDRPGEALTSRLSPHLHFGEIGPAQVAARLERLGAETTAAGTVRGAESYLRELGWREFAHHLLYHFPHTPEAPLQERFARLPWRPATAYRGEFERWQRGATGLPMVDAGMRELWHTGWMHNRVRMIVASLLTKNLLVPWQEGARWFWDTLVDADLANNTLGWQWTAGCGADASPWYRVFNPVLQSRKFDPQGKYLRRWLPELAALPDALLHEPWKAPAARRGGYPDPVVDLAASRERALAALAAIKPRNGPD
jgi:deoxyribodipyrimidine photo-lyase